MYHKVLFTASSFAHIRSFHLPYLKAFHEAGANVHIACGGRVLSLPGVDRHISVPFEKRMISPSNFRSAQQLRRLIFAEHYDLIITHTSLAAFFTRLAVLGMKNVPHIIYMCHGYLFDDDSSIPRRQLLLSAELLVAGKTDLLLNMNRYDYELANSCHLGRRIAIIPGVGVNYTDLDRSLQLDRETLRNKLGISQDAFVLFYAAEFSKRKNQEFLIRAMPFLPESVVLVLAGVGDHLEECRCLVEALQLYDRVLFPGHVSPVSDWYSMADAAVSSSRSEGLPFNIMEAMHFGLPIIASNVKGNADLIKNDETGLLFPYDDQIAFINAVNRLLDNKELCNYLGRHAVSVSEAYSLDRVFPIVWEHYLSFL